MRVWSKEVPLSGKPKRTVEVIDAYGEWLKETKLPKLCFYGRPGAIIKENDAEFIQNNFPNIKMIDMAESLHFVQEDHPNLIGSEIASWYKTI